MAGLLGRVSLDLLLRRLPAAGLRVRIWIRDGVRYNNGYYAGGSYYADRNAGAYGGLSFDIQPSDADLYIDGEYVGQVGVFTPYGEPLTLVAGVHRIAVVRDGYRTMEWDVTVEPGMVLPYQGAMEPW